MVGRFFTVVPSFAQILCFCSAFLYYSTDSVLFQLLFSVPAPISLLFFAGKHLFCVIAQIEATQHMLSKGANYLTKRLFSTQNGNFSSIFSLKKFFFSSAATSKAPQNQKFNRKFS